MLQILIILLTINLFLIYIFFEKKFLSPSFLLTIGMLFSSCVALLVQDSWKFSLSIETVFVFYFSNIIFIFGEFFIFFVLKTKYLKKNNIKVYKHSNNKVKFFTCMVSLIISLIYIYDLLNVAIASGWQSGSHGILYYIRRGLQYSDSISVSRIASWSFNILEAISYYSLYALICLKSRRKNFFYSGVNIFFYIILVVLTAGRFPLIIFFITGVCLWITKEYKGKKRTITVNNKIMKKILIPIICFAVCFLLIGFFRRNPINDMNKDRKMIDTVALYAGSGVVAFDQYIIKEGVRAEYPGQTTLNGFFDILNRFGGSYKIEKNTLDFVELTTVHSTNIYSALGRLVFDYGIMGSFIIVFFMSLFYSLFFYLVRNKSGYLIFLYAFMVYPLLMFGIDEGFFIRFFSINFIVEVVLFYLMFAIYSRSIFIKNM